MNRQEKAENVTELKETLGKVVSLIVADYRGLTVEEVNGLRSEIRKGDCTYRVVKNTLVKRAIADTSMAGLAPLFTGPTAVAYSFQDPVGPAKILDKFATDLAHLEVKGGYLDGKVLDANGVKSLASMKGKDELRAELLATFMAPAQGFVRLVGAVATNFLYLLQARKDSLGETGESSESPGAPVSKE
jgi:large subunit ribosomal protein L10